MDLVSFKSLLAVHILSAGAEICAMGSPEGVTWVMPMASQPFESVVVTVYCPAVVTVVHELVGVLPPDQELTVTLFTHKVTPPLQSTPLEVMIGWTAGYKVMEVLVDKVILQSVTLTDKVVGPERLFH
jgi:hypothetical protein